MGQKWGKSEKMKTFAGHFLEFVWLKYIQIHFKFNKISISRWKKSFVQFEKVFKIFIFFWVCKSTICTPSSQLSAQIKLL